MIRFNKATHKFGREENLCCRWMIWNSNDFDWLRDEFVRRRRIIRQIRCENNCVVIRIVLRSSHRMKNEKNLKEKLLAGIKISLSRKLKAKFSHPTELFLHQRRKHDKDDIPQVFVFSFQLPGRFFISFEGKRGWKRCFQLNNRESFLISRQTSFQPAKRAESNFPQHFSFFSFSLAQTFLLYYCVKAVMLMPMPY